MQGDGARCAYRTGRNLFIVVLAVLAFALGWALRPSHVQDDAVSAPTAVANQDTDAPQPELSSEREQASYPDARPSSFDVGRNLPAVINAANRQHIDLSGEWRFLIDVVDEGLRSRRRGTKRRDFPLDVHDDMLRPRDLKEYDFYTAPAIKVPGSWKAQFPELSYYDGTVWYRKRFPFDASTEGERKVLQFEAANYHTMVFLNGETVGEHWGGFTPFAFDVTDLLIDGENSLVVAVNAKRSNLSVPPANYDWDNFGGITRAVRLITLPDTYIDEAWVRLADDGETILADVSLTGASPSNARVRIVIPELGIAEELTTDDQSKAVFSLAAGEGLQKWSPENPKLYQVDVVINSETLSDSIGFRTVEVVGQDILLNGAPVFLRGISMHEEALGATAERISTREEAYAQLEIVKNDLHGNFIRLSHYPHNEDTVRLADEMGLLVWSEIPVYWAVAFDNPSVLELALDMQEANIRRDKNRASVVIWSVGNETPINDVRNAFMQSLIDRTRELDPSRLVSMAIHQVRMAGGDVVTIDDPMVAAVDILSVNFYTGWYGSSPLSRLNELSFDPGLTKPLVFTEYGAGALAGFYDPEERRKFSEEFQADYYQATIDMIKRIPSVSGSSPWILKDFRSPRRFHPIYQDYWNRKGIIGPEGERKMAFDVLRVWYADLAAEEGRR